MNFATLVGVLGPTWAVSWDINRHRADPLWPASNLSLVVVFPQTAGDGAHEHTHRHAHADSIKGKPHIPSSPSPGRCRLLQQVSLWLSMALSEEGVEERDGSPPLSLSWKPEEDGGLRKPTVSLVPLVLKALSIFPHLPDPVPRPWSEQSVCWFCAVCFKHSQSMWVLPRQRKPAGSSYLITALVSVS